MKAIQLNSFGIENLVMTEVVTPVIGENEVLVKITAASLQYLDLIMVEGTVMPDLALPHIPVSEGMGIIAEIGDKVSQWKKGDRVLIPFVQRWETGKVNTHTNHIRTGMQVQGTLAEFIAIPANTLVKAPSNLTDEEAASLSVAGLTAWANLVTKAKVKAGQTILIQGTGGVSLYALQLSKMLGLNIIATTGSAGKESKLKALGVAHVINYKAYPEWSKEVKRLTNGAGVDITLDVAGNESIEQSILSCKENAYIGLVGFMTGSKITVDVFPIIMNYIQLQGYSVGSASELMELAAAIEVNQIKPIIDSVYEVENTQTAFRRLKSGEAFGKIIIKL